MKLNVYIDGFNVYYGAVRGTPTSAKAGWCDQPVPSDRSQNGQAPVTT
jgi:hypothetical protein